MVNFLCQPLPALSNATTSKDLSSLIVDFVMEISCYADWNVYFSTSCELVAIQIVFKGFIHFDCLSRYLNVYQ